MEQALEGPRMSLWNRKSTNERVEWQYSYVTFWQKQSLYNYAIFMRVLPLDIWFLLFFLSRREGEITSYLYGFIGLIIIKWDPLAWHTGRSDTTQTRAITNNKNRPISLVNKNLWKICKCWCDKACQCLKIELIHCENSI